VSKFEKGTVVLQTMLHVTECHFVWSAFTGCVTEQRERHLAAVCNRGQRFSLRVENEVMRMEPITTAIVTALSTGAAFVGKETATAAVKDAYGSFKAWIQRHYTGVSIDQLEQQPASKALQDVVGEDLERVNASEDPEIVRRARELVDLIEKEGPDAARAVGIDIRTLQNAKTEFEEVVARKGATGVKIDTVTGGELKFGKVTAGTEDGDTTKKQ
jgi:hypothetical protein